MCLFSIFLKVYNAIESGSQTIEQILYLKSVTIPAGMQINSTNFTDAEFQSYVSKTFDTDGNGYLSSGEIANVTSIDVSNTEVTDLTGIENFTALTSLKISDTAISSLGVSGNSELTTLNVRGTPMTALDVSVNEKLESVDISNTAITSLSLPTNFSGTLTANNLLTSTIDATGGYDVEKGYWINLKEYLPESALDSVTNVQITKTASGVRAISTYEYDATTGRLYGVSEGDVVTFTYNPGGTSTITPALQVSTYSLDGTVKVADGTEVLSNGVQVKAPSGTTIDENGNITIPEGGSVIALDGTVTTPTIDGDAVHVGLWVGTVVLAGAVLGFFGYKKAKKNIIEE